eukprot:scaffold12308_cov74-Cyclotella_meneghiniana.AAC.14
MSGREDETNGSTRRRPSPSPAEERAPLTLDHLEIDSNERNINHTRAPRSPLYSLSSILFCGVAAFLLIVSFPIVKHHSAQKVSQSDAPDYIATNDGGPRKGAHMFVKPGGFRDRADGSGKQENDEFSSDEKDSQETVPPKKGLAYLTPDEFKGIRLARPNESVLLTGGLGFIGSHVADLLLHRGFKVTILDDESNGHNHNEFCVEMVPNDITVVKDLPKFPTGEEKNGEEVMYFTHVIHLAAAISVAESMTDPEKYHRVNLFGSQMVLDWIKEYNSHVSKLLNSNKKEVNGSPTLIRKVVAASSAAIYGDPDPKLLPLKEDTPYGGLSPYADTKYKMEGLMRDFVDSQNVEMKKNSNEYIPPASATALRFFNVYGPRQDPKNPYSGVISLFLEMASHNKDITILGDGLMTRDFVYVKDVARAVSMALLQEKGDDDPGSFSVYNVCTGKHITINTLATQVKQSMKSSSEIVHLDPRAGDIRDSRCNPGNAASGMNFLAAVTQEMGLLKTANWFREKDDLRMLRDRSSRRLDEQNYPELI